MFSNCNGLSFQGGKFYNILEGGPHRMRGLDILHRHVTLEALYDSAESFPQPRCHPETRVKLLEDLWHQIQDPETRVLWLHGPAGAGKSAVMQALCQRLQGAGQLGGSYFFKRNHPTRGSGTVLFATLAYQLAVFDLDLGIQILQMVETNPSLVATSISSQLEALIIKPCVLAQDCAPRTLLIDGLDECDGIAVQQEILHSILHTFRAHTLPLKIIIASRPEPDLGGVFHQDIFAGLCTINIEQSFADVETFLRREFSRIHKEHPTMANVPSPWPPADVLKTLVGKSSGYFISASTVIKFVDDKDFRPVDQLAVIMNPSSFCDTFPYVPLDRLYFQILSQVPERLRPRLLAILTVIFTFPVQLSIREMEQLLGLEDGDVQLTLRRLHSVLSLHDAVTPIHASFSDFLLNKTRSSLFHIGIAQAVNLGRSMLDILSSPLPQSDHVIWKNGMISACIDHLTSIDSPCAELLPLLQQLNFDTFFQQDDQDCERQMEKLLVWMKRVLGSSEDTIARWEHAKWINDFLRVPAHPTHSQFLCQSTTGNLQLVDLFAREPRVLQILTLVWCLVFYQHPWQERVPLFSISGLGLARFLLNLSWDDIFTSMGQLRSIYPARDLTYKFCLDYHCFHHDILAVDYDCVARGYARLLRQVSIGELNAQIWQRLPTGRIYAGVWESRRLWSDAELRQELELILPPQTFFSQPGVKTDHSLFRIFASHLRRSRLPIERARRSHNARVPEKLISRWERYEKEAAEIMERKYQIRR